MAVLRARGLVSARGDSGEPQVCLECAGAQLAATQPARTGGAEPSWFETFTLCLPASALLLPSGAVQPDGGALHVVVRDTCTSSKVTGEIEMASCDLALAGLLLRDAVTLTCALEPSGVADYHPSGGAAAAAGEPGASLELRLRLVHVGEPQQDDAMPGVPRDLAARRTADGSKRKQSAAAMQAAFPHPSPHPTPHPHANPNPNPNPSPHSNPNPSLNPSPNPNPNPIPSSMQAAFRGRQARAYTSGLVAKARSMAQALVEETAAAAAAAAATAAATAGLLPSPPPPRIEGVSRAVARRRRRRRLRALLLSLALVACVAVSLLLFYLSESAQCQLAGSPGACVALLLGLR